MTESEYWKIFTRRFNESRPSVFKVAEYLHREKKLTVTIPAMQIAPKSVEAQNYLDAGDIQITTADGKKFIVDVKHKQVDFTHFYDYPCSDIMIANVRAADRVNPFAYFIVNRKCTHAFIARGDTKKHWTKEPYGDKERGGQEEKYMCNKALGEFVKL